jgi:hypothetical protein
MLPQNLLGGLFRPISSSDYQVSRERRIAFWTMIVASILIPLTILRLENAYTKVGICSAIAVSVFCITALCISEFKTPRSVANLLIPAQHILLAYNYLDGGMRLVVISKKHLDSQPELFYFAIPIAFIPRYPYGEAGEAFNGQWTAEDSQQISASGSIWLEVPEGAVATQLMNLLEYSKESLAQMIASLAHGFLDEIVTRGQIGGALDKPVTDLLRRKLKLPPEVRLDVKLRHVQVTPGIKVSQ